jgi:outer membrane protein assembly factor BamB
VTANETCRRAARREPAVVDLVDHTAGSRRAARLFQWGDPVRSVIQTLAAAAWLTLALPCLAEDWPEFRGPTGQGLAQGRLPLKWGPELNVAWKQPIPGLGWSSPIVCHGRIYLTTAVPGSGAGDQSLRALCLDAGTGKLLWSTEVFRQDGKTAPRIHGKNSHASPTPLTNGRRLYVHFGHQGTACLDLDGNVVWRNSSLTYQPVHGNGGSPVLVDDALIFSADGGDRQFVAALSRNSGKVLWQTPRKTDAFKKFSFGTPLVITVAGKKQVVSAGSNVVSAYDPATGHEIWRVRHQGYSVVPRPVFGLGLVFVATGYDSPGLLAIRPDGQGDVTASHVAWKIRQGAPLSPSPLLVGDDLYLVSDSGVVSCLDARTGKLHWKERIGGQHSASPLLAGDRIYFEDEAGTGTVIRAGRHFELLARNVLGEKTLASYAAADGALFIRTQQHLYRIQGH